MEIYSKDEGANEREWKGKEWDDINYRYEGERKENDI